MGSTLYVGDRNKGNILMCIVQCLRIFLQITLLQIVQKKPHFEVNWKLVIVGKSHTIAPSFCTACNCWNDGCRCMHLECLSFQEHLKSFQSVLNVIFTLPRQCCKSMYYEHDLYIHTHTFIYLSLYILKANFTALDTLLLFIFFNCTVTYIEFVLVSVIITEPRPQMQTKFL